ncbi:MAG TPA: head-tail connector protein [Desulfosporosinus sp.]|nr:head-tail connector protein [Desulfosporosinus sp.]
MFLEKVKTTLRIDDDSLDEDIQDTIDSATGDLKLCGITEEKIVETDPLILRAVKTFCKAEYSSDEKETDRYRQSYEMLRNHLSMSVDYNQLVVVL